MCISFFYFYKVKKLLCIVILYFSCSLNAQQSIDTMQIATEENNLVVNSALSDNIILNEDSLQANEITQTHQTISDSSTISTKKPSWFRRNQKKIVATILAFPIPFGIIGLHRVYLGTNPYIPVVYVATFGILSIFDFFALLIKKDIHEYQNNKKVFMWVK